MVKYLLLLMLVSRGNGKHSDKENISTHIYHECIMPNNKWDIKRLSAVNKKTKRIIYFVWTPQHSPIPYPDHYAFNFENKGWVYNPDKGCYEIWMKQNGYFNDAAQQFEPADGKVGSHRIRFSSRTEFIEWQKLYSL